MYRSSTPGVALTTLGWSAFKRAFEVLPVDDIALCTSALCNDRRGQMLRNHASNTSARVVCVGVDGLLQANGWSMFCDRPLASIRLQFCVFRLPVGVVSVLCMNRPQQLQTLMRYYVTVCISAC